MTARTHDVIAFAALVSIAAVNPPQNLSVLTLFAALVSNIIGGLLPDIDQAGNKLWDMFPIGNTVGKIFRRLFYKHRTITHSLLGVFLTYTILSLLLPKIFNSQYVDPYIILISLMIGYISHLFADSLTKEGLPLLFPIKWAFGFPPFEFARITTGKWVEKYIVFPGVGLYLILFVLDHQNQLVNIFKSIGK